MDKKLARLRKAILTIAAAVLAAAATAACSAAEPTVTPAPIYTRQPTPTPSRAAQPSPTPTPTPAPTAIPDELRLAAKMPATLNPLLNEDITVAAILRLVFEPLMEIRSGVPEINENITESVAFGGLSATVTIKQGARWRNGEIVTAADLAYSIGVLRGAPDGAVYKSCVKGIESCVVTGERTATVVFSERDSDNLFAFCFPVISERDPLSGSGVYAIESYTPLKELVLRTSREGFPKRARVTLVREAYSIRDCFESMLTDFFNAKNLDVKRISKRYEYESRSVDFLRFNFAKTPLGTDGEGREIRAAITKLALGEEAENAAEILGGRAFILLVNEESEERAEVCENLRERLARAGANAVVEKAEFGEFSRRIAAGQYDVALCGATLAEKAGDALDFLRESYSKTHRFNAELGDLFNKLREAADTAEYKAAVEAIELFYEYNAVTAIIARKTGYALYSERFAGCDTELWEMLRGID